MSQGGQFSYFNILKGHVTFSLLIYLHFVEQVLCSKFIYYMPRALLNVFLIL